MGTMHDSVVTLAARERASIARKPEPQPIIDVDSTAVLPGRDKVEARSTVQTTPPITRGQPGRATGREPVKPPPQAETNKGAKKTMPTEQRSTPPTARPPLPSTPRAKGTHEQPALPLAPLSSKQEALKLLLEQAASEEKRYNGNKPKQKEERALWQLKVLSDLNTQVFGRPLTSADMKGNAKTQKILQLRAKLELELGPHADHVRWPQFLGKRG